MSLHVVPVGDAFEHATSGDCVCEPSQRFIERRDGTTRWATVHSEIERDKTRDAERHALGGA